MKIDSVLDKPFVAVVNVNGTCIYIRNGKVTKINDKCYKFEAPIGIDFVFDISLVSLYYNKEYTLVCI